MSRRRKQKRGDCRPVNGILLFDKPAGMTSNQALQRVKRLFKACKAGHTGSLDPLATGLLPICFGEATKISSYLLTADKYYRTRARLGIVTDTGDAEGNVRERHPVQDYDAPTLEAVLAGFRGVQQQVPPMHSAVKHQGQRLYELARQGVAVAREAREITIHRLEALPTAGPYLELDIHCSKGTYIRTLIEDIGARLGCGAHVVELRRYGVGPYQEPDMIDLARLETLAEAGETELDAVVRPLDSALTHWPRIDLDADSTFFVREGQAVQVSGAPVDGLVRLYGGAQQFLGVGEVLDDGRIGPRRLLR